MGRIYKDTYEGIYRLHAKHGRVPPHERGDNYWESVVSDMAEYTRQHNDPFTGDLLSAVSTNLSGRERITG